MGSLYGLLGALPWVWQSDSSFRDLLSSRPRCRKLKMWFQALEFAASCTVAKCTFYCCCCRRNRRSYLFQKSALVLPRAPTVETRATQLRFLSRCPCWHLVRAGLATAAATVFLDGAAEEQRSTVYTVAAELWMNYEVKKIWYDESVRTSSWSFYSSEKYTWPQYKKRRIQAPGTTFSNFSDKVGM